MDTPVIYIFTEGPSGPCKIGRSTSQGLWDRAKALQTGNPRPIDGHLQLACLDAVNLERRMHQRLAEWRLQGEWFAVSPAQAKRELMAVIASGCLAQAQSMSAEQAAKLVTVRPERPRRRDRKEYQRELMRKRRAELKAAKEKA